MNIVITSLLLRARATLLKIILYITSMLSLSCCKYEECLYYLTTDITAKISLHLFLPKKVQLEIIFLLLNSSSKY